MTFSEYLKNSHLLWNTQVGTIVFFPCLKYCIASWAAVISLHSGFHGIIWKNPMSEDRWWVKKMIPSSHLWLTDKLVTDYDNTVIKKIRSTKQKRRMEVCKAQQDSRAKRESKKKRKMNLNWIIETYWSLI